MTIDLPEIVTGISIVLLGTSIVTVAKHMSNSEKHPNKKEFVKKEVCEIEMKSAEKELKAIKELMNRRFDSLEYLIKNGGDSNPRIQT